MNRFIAAWRAFLREWRLQKWKADRRAVITTPFD